MEAGPTDKALAEHREFAIGAIEGLADLLRKQERRIHRLETEMTFVLAAIGEASIASMGQHAVAGFSDLAAAKRAGAKDHA